MPFEVVLPEIFSDYVALKPGNLYKMLKKPMEVFISSTLSDSVASLW